jgi:DHA2 family multidrug resistance protein-like MFS transporter
LGGAVAAADGLPDQLGTQLLDAAREAFAQGLQLSSITSVALVLGMATLVLVLLRHIRAGGETAETAEEADAVTTAVEERS